MQWFVSWVTRIVVIIVTEVNILEHYAKIINMMNFFGLPIFQYIASYDICPIENICFFVPSRFNFWQWYAILLFWGCNLVVFRILLFLYTILLFSTLLFFYTPLILISALMKMTCVSIEKIYNSIENGHLWRTPHTRVKGPDMRPFNLI